MALVSYPLIRVLILTGIKPDTYQSVKPWLRLDSRLEKFFGEPFFVIIFSRHKDTDYPQDFYRISKLYQIKTL